MLDFYSSAIICTCLYFFIYVVFKKKNVHKGVSPTWLTMKLMQAALLP